MRYRVDQNGRFLSTRDRGAALRAQIEALLGQASPGEPLIVDFAGVELMSSSIADEIVARVMIDRASSSLGNGPVLIENAGQDLLDPIVRSLQRRELIGAAIEDGYVHLLAAPSHLQATLDAAVARQEFRTADLAADLGISVPACNNRLQQLLSAGLLTRTPRDARPGGREFLYRITIPIPALASDGA